MREPVTYAVVGGPPLDWWNMRVWDLDRMTYVDEVIEVDTVKGLVLRYFSGPDGRPVIAPSGDEYLRVEVEGRFAIDRPGEVRSELWTGRPARDPRLSIILFQRGATSWGFQVGALYMYWPLRRFWAVGCRPTFGWERDE